MLPTALVDPYVGATSCSDDITGASAVPAAAATKEAAVAVRNLVTLAEELRGSVVAFRLPESDVKAVAGR